MAVSPTLHFGATGIIYKVLLGGELVARPEVVDPEDRQIVEKLAKLQSMYSQVVKPFPSEIFACSEEQYNFWSSGTTRSYSAPNVIDAEPYYIAHTAEHLTFDERYVAWGGDKAEQFHRVMLQVRQETTH